MYRQNSDRDLYLVSETVCEERSNPRPGPAVAEDHESGLDSVSLRDENQSSRVHSASYLQTVQS